jgi:hypothetical protein
MILSVIKKVPGMVLCTALLCFAGCLDYEEVLVLNADGSATIQMKYAVDKVYLNQTKAMYEQMAQYMPEMEVPEDPADLMFDKAHIDATLAEENSGVELLAYDVSSTDQAQVWFMSFAIADINNIVALDKALSPQQDQFEQDEQFQEADPVDEHPLLTKQDDGTLLFYRSFDDDLPSQDFGDGAAEESENWGDYQGEEYDDSDDPLGNVLTEQLEEELGQFVEGLDDIANGMRDHTLRFSVTFPGEIIESNATSVDGNTAVWEYTLEELDQLRSPQTAIIKP